MVRLRNTEKQEITTTFYGINPKTCSVEQVSLNRGGSLTKWTSGAQYIAHPVPFGKSARHEVVVVFGLIDIIEVTQFDNSKSAKRRIAELTKKAEAMKSSQ